MSHECRVFAYRWSGAADAIVTRRCVECGLEERGRWINVRDQEEG